MIGHPELRRAFFLATVLLALCIRPAAAAGYSVVDSNQVGGPAYSFENISATGTSIALGDDQVSGAIPSRLERISDRPSGAAHRLLPRRTAAESG